IDVSPDAIYIIDTDLTYVLANPAGAELAGCTQEELIGTPIAETFVPEERPLLPARMEMMKTEPHLRFERKFVRRNGDIVPVEVSLTTVRGRYLQAILRDISERKRGSAESFGAGGTRPGRSPDLQSGRFGDRIGAGKVSGKNAEHDLPPT